MREHSYGHIHGCMLANEQVVSHNLSGKRNDSLRQKQSSKSGRKWAFIGFLFGCAACVILRATEVIPRPQIAGNIAQQGGADIGFVLAFGIVFSLIGLSYGKLKG